MSILVLLPLSLALPFNPSSLLCFVRSWGINLKVLYGSMTVLQKHPIITLILVLHTQIKVVLNMYGGLWRLSMMRLIAFRPACIHIF